MTSNAPSEYLYIQAVKLILRRIFDSGIDASRVFVYAKTPQERLLVMHEDPFDAALALVKRQRPVPDDTIDMARDDYARLKTNDDWMALFKQAA